MQDDETPQDAPTGMPEDEPEAEPLGVPDADPGGKETPLGPENMPGIPTEGEPPAAS
jgi:hypothetical protein